MDYCVSEEVSLDMLITCPEQAHTGRPVRPTAARGAGPAALARTLGEEGDYKEPPHGARSIGAASLPQRYSVPFAAEGGFPSTVFPHAVSPYGRIPLSSKKGRAREGATPSWGGFLTR